ncbi:TetR family transcriptional regulator [Sphaerisporangium krabiense]|uniref:AcrR family transcriptional regulator n=1 Tax=Sphaerisporangium krabiense TaxID=763782 RepID=A0A7W9DQX5_9ACTN|nr:TetR/AcrR family transcriptional regulator [Sphaerisporangium krabiense]MBB5627966.1 AcrR family transcriptional regulator [Sphaerisporangium krabiense]GII62128.1 TetR family transcriptional regulator [Sphaerisporangium krabiense]
MPKPTDTKRRIQAVARELFARQGVRKTSLQEIANRLGITKPALYYHFSSREELVRSIVQPLIDDGEAFLSRQEALGAIEPRALLEEYFDFTYGHRDVIVLVLAELTTLAELGLFDLVLAWRERIVALLCGPEPTLAEATRAVVALGGLQDCTIQFPDAPLEELRRATVNAACAALGIQP